MSVRRMRDVTAESGIIRKEMKRIFQRVSEIIDKPGVCLVVKSGWLGILGS